MRLPSHTHTHTQFDVTSAFIARASKKQSAAAQKPRPSPKDSSPSSNTGTVSSSTSLHSAEGSPTHSQSALHTLDPEVRRSGQSYSIPLESLVVFCMLSCLQPLIKHETRYIAAGSKGFLCTEYAVSLIFISRQ